LLVFGDCSAIGLAGPILLAHGLVAPAPSWSGDELLHSSEGFATLAWTGAPDDRFELEQAQEADFSDAVVVYRGAAPASFVSGLRDGTYHFRVRTHDSDWSGPVHLRVAHHPLPLALASFAAGAAVFLATAIFLGIAAQRKER
jgi:hypothetical protein